MIPTSITLKVLHDIIQDHSGRDWDRSTVTSGSSRSPSARYGRPSEENWGGEPFNDARKIRLREVLPAEIRPSAPHIPKAEFDQLVESDPPPTIERLADIGKPETPPRSARNHLAGAAPG